MAETSNTADIMERRKFFIFMKKLGDQTRNAVLSTIFIKFAFILVLKTAGENYYITRIPKSVFNDLFLIRNIYSSNEYTLNLQLGLYSIVTLILSAFEYSIYQVIYLDVVSSKLLQRYKIFFKRKIPNFNLVKMFLKRYPVFMFPLFLIQAAMTGLIFFGCIMKILCCGTIFDVLLICFLEAVVVAHLFILFISLRLIRIYLKPDYVHEYLKTRFDPEVTQPAGNTDQQEDLNSVSDDRRWYVLMQRYAAPSTSNGPSNVPSNGPSNVPSYALSPLERSAALYRRLRANTPDCQLPKYT